MVATFNLLKSLNIIMHLVVMDADNAQAKLVKSDTFVEVAAVSQIIGETMWIFVKIVCISISKVMKKLRKAFNLKDTRAIIPLFDCCIALAIIISSD